MANEESARSFEMENLHRDMHSILEASERFYPVISEYQFEREVLDILENPFGKENVTRYLNYVGELTMPLKVVRDNETLFIVPPLMMSFQPYIPSRADDLRKVHFDNDNQRQRTFGKDDTDGLIKLYNDMSMTPSYIDKVILPIRDILSRYNRKMVHIPAVDGVGSSRVQSSSESSFLDEYE